MGTVITRPEQVFNAVAARQGKKNSEYAAITGIPLSSTGKILTKLELAGAVRKQVEAGSYFWYVDKGWDAKAYSEASELIEETWHKSNKGRSKKAGDEDVLVSRAYAVVKDAEVQPFQYSTESKINVEDLTVAEAKRLYKELQDLFK